MIGLSRSGSCSMSPGMAFLGQAEDRPTRFGFDFVETLTAGQLKGIVNLVKIATATRKTVG